VTINYINLTQVLTLPILWMHIFGNCIRISWWFHCWDRRWYPPSGAFYLTSCICKSCWRNVCSSILLCIHSLHCCSISILFTNKLKILIQSLPIITDVVSSNLDLGEVYNIMWKSLSVTCDRLVVFSGSSGFLHK
jgi:hypothetical protein